MRHCLLIVPTMRIDEVKQWNGSGYNAIVLAGNFKDSNDDRIWPASKVYNRITDMEEKSFLPMKKSEK